MSFDITLPCGYFSFNDDTIQIFSLLNNNHFIIVDNNNNIFNFSNITRLHKYKLTINNKNIFVFSVNKSKDIRKKYILIKKNKKFNIE